MTLLSGDLVMGVPKPARRFVEDTFQFALQEIFNSKAARKMNSKERNAFAGEKANEVVASFNMPAASSESHGVDAVTLAEVTVLWGGRGDGAKIPTVRVPLSSVAMWWVNGARQTKGAGNTFVGVSMNLPS